MKKMLLGIIGILALLVVIFLLEPAPIDPSAYTPPMSPELTGVLIVALDEERNIIQSRHAPNAKHLQTISPAQEYGRLKPSGDGGYRPGS